MKKKQKFRFQVVQGAGGLGWYWRLSRGNNGPYCTLSDGTFPTRLAAVESIGRFCIAVDAAKIEIVEEA